MHVQYEDQFVNRQKSTFNVQLVCNQENKITNIIAQWPDSTHDAWILHDRILAKEFQEGGAQRHLSGRQWLSMSFMAADLRQVV